MRKLCKYISIFSLSLSRLSRQSFLKTRESALYSLKSPISRRYIQGTEDNLYQVGCPSVRIYKCLAILKSMHGWQPTFFIFILLQGCKEEIKLFYAMKRLLYVMCILVLSVGFISAQNLLGKTKEQAKGVVAKRILPKSFSDGGVAIGSEYGYERWWHSSEGKSTTLYYYYFNNDICFLEYIMTNDVNLVMTSLDYYNKKSDYNIYGNDNPQSIETHQFIKDKISIEITTKKNPVLGGSIFYIYFFKPEDKQNILNFFKNKYCH